jgi:SpoIID/LytB domain protein
MTRRWVQRVAAVGLAIGLAAGTIQFAGAGDAPHRGDLDIDGAGWGHGIGMSQYGALGQALDGRSAEQILAYYYTGSSTSRISDRVAASNFLRSDEDPLWVSLLRNQTSFSFEAIGGPVDVCQAGQGGCKWKAKPGETWEFKVRSNGTCRFKRDGAAVTDPGRCKGSLRGLSPSGSHVRVIGVGSGRDTFGRGDVNIRTPDDGASVQVSLEISMDDYLYGLAEVPLSWPREALRAQSIAARSYAATRAINQGPESSFTQARKEQCWCHLYSTIVDQSYVGWAHELASHSDDWKAAVDDTSGVVVTHPAAGSSGIVSAFYSSSSGGATENNEDVWGGNPLPYLRSRPDPWSVSAAVGNPYASWSFPFTEQQLAGALGLDEIDGLDIVERFASGTPKRIDVNGVDGGKRVVLQRSGADLMGILSLRGRHITKLDYGDIAALTGDFDGDGVDEAAAMLGWNAAWWVGGGQKFEPWANHGADGGWQQVLTGDFSGDGRADVAAYRSDGKWRVGVSAGGRFAFSAWGPHASGAWTNGVVGDFDGDGRDDIADYLPAKTTWRVLRSTGDDFDASVWYDFVVQSPNWGAIVAGDFDGNGYDDIAHLDANTGDLIVLFSNGSSFVPSTWARLPNAGPWQHVLAGDFDGNGRDDIAAYDRDTGRWWVVEGRKGATGRQAASWVKLDRPGQNLRHAVTGDFDGDGDDDIATFTAGNHKLKVMRSNGQHFHRQLWGKAPSGGIATMQRADTNGDESDDLVLFSAGKRRFWESESASGGFAVSGWGKLLR